MLEGVSGRWRCDGQMLQERPRPRVCSLALLASHFPVSDQTSLFIGLENKITELSTSQSGSAKQGDVCTAVIKVNM